MVCLPQICHVDFHNDNEQPVLMRNCTFKDSEVFNMAEQLLNAEKLNPGMLDFFVKNNVLIEIVPEIMGYDKEGRTVKATGSARCMVGSGNLKFVGNPHISVIMHEYAHCRENVERGKKGLPLIERGKTGGWMHNEETVIPLGHEARAEHFSDRMEFKREKQNQENLERIKREWRL